MTRIPAPDPAAERSPVARRAARASVPGGPAASESPYGAAGGKTSRQAVSQDTTPDGTRASSRATPRTGPRDGTREEAPGTPAGAAPASPREATSAAPDRTRLRGAEALKAIQRAQAKARRGPAVRKPAARAAAPSVAASGAPLAASARCLSGCGWTAGPGDPAEVDKAAAGHTKAGHATNLFSEPVAGAA